MASASPSENGSAPGGGGCAASPSAASIARAHSLSLVSLPDEQHQARLGSKGGGDVGERGGRIGEEHRPEAADRHVEAGGVEAMHLGVAQLVPDVVEPFGRRHLTGALEHALGHVDADNAARRRGARRLASRQPGSAPDVDYLVTGADPVGGAKVLVVSAQLGVVEVQAVRRGHRRDANAVAHSPLRGDRGALWRTPRIAYSTSSHRRAALDRESRVGRRRRSGVRRLGGRGPRAPQRARQVPVALAEQLHDRRRSRSVRPLRRAGSRPRAQTRAAERGLVSVAKVRKTKTITIAALVITPAERTMPCWIARASVRPRSWPSLIRERVKTW